MEDFTDSQAIMQLGLAFWGSKVLLTAVEIGVFARLAQRPHTLEELSQQLSLNGRGARDFFDALVSLQMVQREGDHYANTPQTDRFLDPAKPTYIGGLLELASRRLYATWGNLTSALRTGQPQNESKHEPDHYRNLYSDPARLRLFLRAMTGLSMAAGKAITEKFPWQKYASFVDIGGAHGLLAVQLATAHGHLVGGSFDLPPIEPIFAQQVGDLGLSHRLRFYPGDFFKDPLPGADVLIMGHVLHNWNLAQKRILLQKAFDALPAGGALLVHEALIDEDRSQHTFGLLMSLNMLLSTPGGFVFTGSECQAWMREVGFKESRVEHLHGPDWMVIGLK